MRTSFRQIAQFMDSVEPPNSLRRLLEMHRMVDGSNGFAEVWRRHNHRHLVEQSFLFLNTWLMDVWIFREGPDGGKKPAVEDRAQAIGRQLSASTDIALLAEVFEDNVKDNILSAWSAGEPHVVEDSQRRTGQSSGLVTMSREYSLSDKEVYRYKFESGSDRLADKGVLLARLDCGFGESQLELYNTHLNAGDDSARKFQVLELVTFIARTHNENNIAIIGGDFNIDGLRRVTEEGETRYGEIKYDNNPYFVLSGGGGRGPDFSAFDSRFARIINDTLESGIYPGGMSEYEILSELLGTLGFQDLWIQRNDTLGYTSNMDKPGVAQQICSPDPGDEDLCNDFLVPSTPDDFDSSHQSSRLDYIFVSRPAAEQTFTVDFTRPRRTRYERRLDAPNRDDIAFLSDHVGLTTTLLVVPR